MRRNVVLTVRSAAIAAATLDASLRPILAHAGESHEGAGGWASIGWTGLAAVVTVGAALWLLVRHGSAEVTTTLEDDEPIGPLNAGR